MDPRGRIRRVLRVFVFECVCFVLMSKIQLILLYAFVVDVTFFRNIQRSMPHIQRFRYVVAVES
jgi:hypothetical protein